jgi:hypothetical protein
VAQQKFFADTLTKSVIYHGVKSGLGESITNANVDQDFLVAPDSVYSQMKSQPTAINTMEWNLALDDFNHDNRVSLTLADSVKLFANENGLTKARPDIEINMSRRRPGYRAEESNLVVANATKAGVDGDIFYKSIFIFGSKYITIAAKFAVAAQILRDSARQVLPAEQSRNGIRKDVLDRYLSTAVTNVHNISEYDKNYLMNLLHRQLRSSDYQSEKFKYGEFTPPAQFRIARLAAAYQDAQGYIGHPPCSIDGKSQNPENSGNLCFTDMTDKALYSWYKNRYAAEMSPYRPIDSGSSMEKLARILLPIAMIMDGLAAVEFFAALEATELGAEEAFTEEEVRATEARYLDRFCPA